MTISVARTGWTRFARRLRGGITLLQSGDGASLVASEQARLLETALRLFPLVLDDTEYFDYLKTMELAEAAKLFKALSSEQRLRVLEIIRKMTEESPAEAPGATKAFSRCCEELNLSPSTVSHHIKELESAGLIDTQRKGQSVCCQVNDSAWARLKAFLG